MFKIHNNTNKDTNNNTTNFSYSDKEYRWERVENETIWSTYLYNLKDNTVLFFCGPLYFDTTNEKTMQASIDIFTKYGTNISK